MVISEKRAKHRWNFFDNNTKAQVALPQFSIQFVVRAFGAFQNVPHLSFVLGKALDVRMTRIAPVTQQAFAKFRIAPDQTAIFQLGVFLKMDAVDEHGVSLTGLVS